MRCPSCNHDNRSNRRFCTACGTSYTPKHLADKILQSKSALEGERKQVTVLFSSQPGFVVESTPIGTIGERVALDHLRWFGEPGGDAFEWERVRLLEVGADGLLRAALFLDPEDRLAASVEGLIRFAAGEAVGRSAGIAPLLAFTSALRDRAWDAARECFAADLVLVDHRPLSFGALDRDQWIASLQANDDLSVGLTWDVFRLFAWNEQGCVVGIRRLGTIADGTLRDLRRSRRRALRGIYREPAIHLRSRLSPAHDPARGRRRSTDAAAQPLDPAGRRPGVRGGRPRAVRGRRGRSAGGVHHLRSARVAPLRRRSSPSDIGG